MLLSYKRGCIFTWIPYLPSPLFWFLASLLFVSSSHVNYMVWSTCQSLNANFTSPNKGCDLLQSTTNIDVPLQCTVGGQHVIPKWSKRNLGELRFKLHRFVSDYQEQGRSVPPPHPICQPPTMPHLIVPHQIALCPIVPHPRRGLRQVVSYTLHQMQETLLTWLWRAKCQSPREKLGQERSAVPPH